MSKPEIILVLAAPKRSIPNPQRRFQAFSATEPTRVRVTPYVRRRLKAGDLVVAQTAVERSRPARRSSTLDQD